MDELKKAVSARDHRVFFGALHGDRLSGSMGFTCGFIRRSKASRESMHGGDCHHWKDAEAWVNGIAEALLHLETTTSSQK